MTRTITLESPAMPLLLGEPALVVTRLQGEESLSALYNYTVTATTPDNSNISWQAASAIDIKSLIGKQMTLRIALNDWRTDIGTEKAYREITGIVQQVRYLGRRNNCALYQMVLRPWLYLAELTSDFRIFQNKTVTEIIGEILADYDFPHEKRISETYPPLEYQVQYGETDFAFIQRLMEAWGLYWFFEHQGQQHKLVIVDNIGAHKPFFAGSPHVVGYDQQTHENRKEYIAEFHHLQTLTSGRWVTNDYDFTRSRADIMSLDSQPRQTSFNQQEIFDWPGNYGDPATGDHLARVRMEEQGAAGSRSQGSAPVPTIVCGCVFTLDHYPLAKANCEYLVLGTELDFREITERTGKADFSLQCHFHVQPVTKIYRHPRSVPRRRTYGPQTAIVVGPPGKEIWTDEYGRIKVRFLWDRYGKNRESDSCWLRVSQPWAGNNFGGICIPRVGHEVIIDFINGDPDRPLVMGSLYNNVTMPPWELPENATQSGWISRTPGGGRANFNGIRFEDKPGLENYWEQAERDMSRLTKRDEEQVIGRSRAVTVGANDALSVAGESSLLVGGALGISVGGEQNDNVGGAKGINVGGAFMTAVGGYHSVVVGGAHQMAAGGAATMTAGGIFCINSANELVISAPLVRIIGSGQLVLQGGQVLINPGDCQNCGGGGGGGGGAIIGKPGIPGILGGTGMVGLSGLPIPTESPTESPTDTPLPTPTETETPPWSPPVG